MTIAPYRSITVETWLWATIAAIPSVISTFGDNIVMDRISPESGVETPYLEILRHPGSTNVRPMVSTGRIIAETFTFDISGWAEAFSTETIRAAMEDIDAALIDADDPIQDGYRIVVDDNGELPPAPAPRPGERPSVRLGKQYSLSALGG